MRARIGTVLLLGAFFAITTNLAAQTAKSHPRVPLTLAFTWNGMAANTVGGSGFWMNGAGLQLHNQIWRGLGIVADVAGTHTGNMGSTGVGLDLLTVTFGPRYTWSRRRLRFYGQGLLGEGFGFNSLFPASRGTTTSDDNFATVTGGGVTRRISPRLGLRLFEADWVRTQLPNSTTDVQNNLRLSAGLILHFR